DEAEAEARDALRVFNGLVSRWPANCAFSEATGPAQGNAKALTIPPAQREEIDGLFRRAFVKARPAGNSADAKAREDWANFCAEMAVASLLAGELSESVTHAAKAMETWEALRQKEPANRSYQARLGQARVALTAFQLLNR